MASPETSHPDETSGENAKLTLDDVFKPNPLSGRVGSIERRARPGSNISIDARKQVIPENEPMFGLDDMLSPGEISIAAMNECDACPACADVCGNPHCRRCAQKCVQRGKAMTMCQVARHVTEESVYLVARGKIYDATRFLNLHPAGAGPILKKAGQECTVDYDFHSAKAKRNIWKTLEIGTVVNCPLNPAPKVESECVIA